MKSLLQLLACLFLVLGVVTGSMAHAAEIGAEKSAVTGAKLFKSAKDFSRAPRIRSSKARIPHRTAKRCW